jgi:hypothetical protein
MDHTADELNLMAGDVGALPGGLGAHLAPMRDLFNRIRLANNERAVFDTSALDRLLAQQWQQVFFRLNMRDLRAVWRYAILSRGLSFTQVRFLLGAWAGRS